MMTSGGLMMREINQSIAAHYNTTLVPGDKIPLLPLLRLALFSPQHLRLISSMLKVMLPIFDVSQNPTLKTVRIAQRHLVLSVVC